MPEDWFERAREERRLEALREERALESRRLDDARVQSNMDAARAERVAQDAIQDAYRRDSDALQARRLEIPAQPDLERQLLLGQHPVAYRATPHISGRACVLAR